jgi:glycosyltransferase involved in cell wall biosynthesis
MTLEPRNILFVAPYVPSRIRVRTYHMVRELAAYGHRVTLFCPARGAADANQLQALRPYCARIVAVPQSRLLPLRGYARAALNGLPLQAGHNLGGVMVATLRELLRREHFDIIHVEHLRAIEVALQARSNDDPPLIYDGVDCISLLFERALRTSPSRKTQAMALVDLARTRRYEAQVAGRCAAVIVTSPEDCWAVRTLAAQKGQPADQIYVVPNGVDLEYFAPQEVARQPATLVFSGKMSYHANHAAALYLLRDIMPLLWRQRADVKIAIVGADPGAELLAFRGDARVQVTGLVPDLRPYLAEATLAVCPIRYGVGIQNKVLEALAMGTPVLASRQATVALNAQPGRDLLTASGAADFAGRILELLDSPERLDLLGLNGRRYVECHHSWAQSVQLLEKVIEKSLPFYHYDRHV